MSAPAARVAGSALRARAPGKVNLCLFLGPSRADGLHELVSLVQPVSLADELELAPAGGQASGDELVCPGVEGPNLAARALAAFRSATGWDAPPVRLTVTKRVPVAAGMGGGSADAAATLRLAARAAGREGDPGVAALAAQLGADVPAALDGGLALVTGAGERVRRVPALEPLGLVVVALEHQLSTARVFAEADRLGLGREPRELDARRSEIEAALTADGRLPAGLWHNDLDAAARSLCPAVEAAAGAVRDAGADRVLVAGSGPTVVGVMLGAGGMRRAGEVARRLRARFPGSVEAAPVTHAFGEVEPVASGA